MFAVAWRPEDKPRIAATFSQSYAPTIGKVIVQVHFASDGRLPHENLALDRGVKAILTQGAALIAPQGLAPEQNPFQAFRIQAPSDPRIQGALVRIGTEPRAIDGERIRPYFVELGNIPGTPTAARPPAAFLPVPIRPGQIIIPRNEWREAELFVPPTQYRPRLVTHRLAPPDHT